MAKPALFALLTLFSAPHLSSALQVSPNSPCSSVCRDSLDLDASDPNSSNTRNSDITCPDASYSSPAGTKFKSCMTCLQSSTFSQGSESDTMWFLYNLRYTAAYCLFGFPNATGISSTPCSTSTACGPLQASLEHGITNPQGTTAYSYCSAGGGAAGDPTNFEHCLPCVAAEGRTDYLVNYFVALEAGCQQKPAPGVLLGLNDTIFASTRIGITDPAAPKGDDTSKPGLGVPVIVGIVAGAVALLLAAAAVTFICLRKRKNRRARASAEADFYTRFNARHRSSMSFQCQTHMVSPRFWPGAAPVPEEDLPTPATDTPAAVRSSIYKPHDPDYPYHSTTAPPTTNKPTPAAGPGPLHITTTVPPQAYASPTSAERVYHSPSDLFRSPLSADSARSTSALLPSSIRPYVPAEHGVHRPQSITAASPVAATGTGTGMTPLLKSHAWPLPMPEQKQMSSPILKEKAPTQDPGQRHIIKLGGAGSVPPPPPPPPIKTSALRGSGGGGMLGMGMGRKSPKIAGSPVESWEIQTAFAAPPKR